MNKGNSQLTLNILNEQLSKRNASSDRAMHRLFV